MHVCVVIQVFVVFIRIYSVSCDQDSAVTDIGEPGLPLDPPSDPEDPLNNVIPVSPVSPVSSGSSVTSLNTTTTSTTTTTSSIPEVCDGVVCENSGACLEGVCVCLPGFHGLHCQIVLPIQPVEVPQLGGELATSTTTTSTTISSTTPTTTTSSTAQPTPTPPTLAPTNKPINNQTQPNSSDNNTKPLPTPPVDNSDVTQASVTTDVISDPCTSEPCLNGAICRPEGATFTCKCPVKYTGALCETAICSEPYLRSPVNGHKLCSNQAELTDISCQLSCDHGYYFSDGQLSITYDCRDGLWLPSEKGVPKCHRLDYCANVTCHNNGTCRELWRDVTCDCLPGFTGSRCNTDIDECESSPCYNGGSCRDGAATFLCTCPPGYAGLRCQTQVVEEPVLRSVSPEYGPQAGGTQITVRGENFIVPAIHIYLYLSDLSLPGEDRPRLLCRVLHSNESYLVAITPPAGEDMLRYMPLAVEFAGGAVYPGLYSNNNPSRLYFQYRPNPQISSIHPTDTIIAGGTSVTIEGSALTSVAVPVVQVTLVATWKTDIGAGKVVTNKDKTLFAQPCEETQERTSTLLVCQMPKLELTDEFIPRPYRLNNTERSRRDLAESELSLPGDRRTLHRQELGRYRPRTNIRHGERKIDRRRREQTTEGSSGNKTDWKYFLGLRLDGLTEYENISSVPELKEYGTLTVHKGPVIVAAPTPINYKQLNDGPLTINGSRLLQGVSSTDYNISVGVGRCVLVDISDVLITCQPPDSRPDNLPGVQDDNPVIMVKIGTNIQVQYGTLYYPSNIWIIIGPVLGVFVVLLAIFIALLLLRRRMKKVQKLRKQKRYNYSPGEMIRLPNMKNNEFDDVFKIPSRESGSLLVFPRQENNSEREKSSPSRGGASSAPTESEDEFDPPEDFYENKETIRRQQSHHEALQQFMGNPKRSSVPRYTAEPKLTEEPQSNNKPVRTGSKSKIRDSNKQGLPEQNSYPGLRSFDSGQPFNEDIYMNDYVDDSTNNAIGDIYENSNLGKASPKKKKKDKPFKPRQPARLPDPPGPQYPVSDIPPPVPNTPRPKLNITPQFKRESSPQYRGGTSTFGHGNSNGARAAPRRGTSHPFEESPYTNTQRNSDEDENDIYVNSPIKSRGLRGSGRGKQGRGRSLTRQGQRRGVDRSATMWK